MNSYRNIKFNLYRSGYTFKGEKVEWLTHSVSGHSSDCHLIFIDGCEIGMQFDSYWAEFQFKVFCAVEKL